MGFKSEFFPCKKLVLIGQVNNKNVWVTRMQKVLLTGPASHLIASGLAEGWCWIFYLCHTSFILVILGNRYNQHWDINIFYPGGGPLLPVFNIRKRGNIYKEGNDWVNFGESSILIPQWLGKDGTLIIIRPISYHDLWMWFFRNKM